MNVAALKVDVHESAQMHRVMRKHFSDVYESTALETGDVLALTDNAKIVIFERKTGNDLLNSIADKALMSQCARMVGVTDKAYLLVTSPIMPDVSSSFTAFGQDGQWKIREMHYDAVMGAILQIQEMGVYYIPCSDYGIAKVIDRVCSRVDQPIKVRPSREVVMQTKEEVFYSGLPGIGTDKAEAVKDMFPSPITALWALSDLAQNIKIPGIGPKTIEGIHTFLGGHVQIDTEQMPE